MKRHQQPIRGTSPFHFLLAAIICLSGCTATPAWHAGLEGAIAQAKREQKPLYVLSIFGDLSKKC